MMDDSKLDLLRRLDAELDGMRRRAETAKTLAANSHSESRSDSLHEHVTSIERAVTSLEAIIQEIRKSWD